MKLLQSLPVKYASSNIAASEDFQRKWTGHAVACVITDFWHGSGEPQNLFAETIRVVTDAPKDVECLFMFENSPESIECVQKLIEANPQTMIAYDCSGTFDARFPKDMFSMSWHPGGAGKVVFNGDGDEIPEAIREAFARSLMISAAVELRHSINTRPADDYRWYMQRILSDEKVSIETMSKYVEILSCGMCATPKHGDYGIETELDLESENLEASSAISKYISATMSMSSRGTPTNIVYNALDGNFAFPVADNVRSYVSDTMDCAQKVKGIMRIWEKAFENTPFGFKDGNFVSAMTETDSSLVDGIATAIGAKSMMDAYLSGVPIEDVLA